MHNDVHDREFYRRMTHDTDQTRVRKKTLPLANLALCALLAAGFAAVSALHYSSNMKTFRKDVENVSELVSESMHQWINSLFTNVKYRIYSGDGGVQSVVCQ